MSSSGRDTPQSQGLRPRTRSTGRSAKRYTPYHKTPRSRRLHVSDQTISRTPDVRVKGIQMTPAGLERSQNLDVSGHEEFDTGALINKAWRVYQTSPMYDISSTPSNLKKYSRFLSSHMEAESMKGFAVGLETDVARSATISVFKGLRVNQGDPKSLRITIKGKPKPGKKDLPTVLEAFLLSVNIDSNATAFVKEGFTYYPILLVKGAKSMTSYLCAFLETEFDCHIKEMEFSSAHLGWMIAMWSGFVPDRTRKPVQLVFKVPERCQGLNKISLTIDAHDCKDLWDCFSDENAEQFHEEQVMSFMRSLELHFYEHFKLNLAKLKLSQIATAVALAGTEGKVKIFSATHLKTVLQFLTQLSWERFMDAVCKSH